MRSSNVHFKELITGNYSLIFNVAAIFFVIVVSRLRY